MLGGPCLPAPIRAPLPPLLPPLSLSTVNLFVERDAGVRAVWVPVVFVRGERDEEARKWWSHARTPAMLPYWD